MSTVGSVWHLHVLGTWEVRNGDVDVLLPPRGQRLIALLLIDGRRPRTYLAGRLWPDTSEHKAASNLRSTVLDLRRRAPGLVHADATTIALAPEVASDLDRLREWMRGRAIGRSAADEARYLVGVEELLPGWYDEWVLAERGRLSALVIDRVSHVVHELVVAEDVEHALPLARVAIQLEPMRESAHRALVAIYLLAGDRIAAWQAYTAFRRRSVSEFGVSPSPQFDALVAPLVAERRARRATGLGDGRSTGVGQPAAQTTRRPRRLS